MEAKMEARLEAMVETRVEVCPSNGGSQMSFSRFQFRTVSACSKQRFYLVNLKQYNDYFRQLVTGRLEYPAGKVVLSFY